VEATISPEPSDGERAAIEAALADAEADAVPAPHSSAWRLAALQEGVEPEPDEHPVRGAERAGL
jgi:hypothetical protein